MYQSWAIIFLIRLSVRAKLEHNQNGLTVILNIQCFCFQGQNQTRNINMETENGFLFEFYNSIRDFVITRNTRIVYLFKLYKNTKFHANTTFGMGFIVTTIENARIRVPHSKNNIQG